MGSLVADFRSVPLFQAVADDDLAALAARAQVRSLPANRMVFKEGEAADSLFVVLSGSVKIYLTDETGKEVVLDTKKAGQYFGEMMLDHRPRSANVVTVEPCEFAVISREDFRGFLRAYPEAAEQLILNLIRVTRGMNQRTREGASVGERLRQYIAWLESVKAPDLPTVRRWMLAKRWVLGGLLVAALAQFYFMDVYLKILSMSSLTVFVGR